MTRKQIREHTFKALFQKEFCDLEEYRERCALYVEEMEELEPACREEIRQRALAVGERLEDLGRSSALGCARVNAADLRAGQHTLRI